MQTAASCLTPESELRPWNLRGRGVINIADGQLRKADDDRVGTRRVDKDSHGAAVIICIADVELKMIIEEEAHLRSTGPDTDAHLSRSAARRISTHDGRLQQQAFAAAVSFRTDGPIAGQ